MATAELERQGTSAGVTPSRGTGADQARDVFVTLTVGGQLCGIPVLVVRDVLGPQLITRIPLAPREVAGSLNLRGRIVTAIDLRTRLGLERADPRRAMSVVVEHQGELYSLLVDQVGEVLHLDPELREENPPTLDATWRGLSKGVFRLSGQLVVVLDVAAILAI
ncbi:chemotaxis protein CheW [Elioraea thermophila]|uniref:chemotaxis protein CheW n=1 Tax=Elioraea thermophila TaxID=2185104 RepID=UPI000DF21CB1|nr:chemotaxis protein CheW [Elioraea thermophila]